MRSNLWMGLVVALLVSSTALAGREQRPTYVLVHGAFHGGWAWQQVAEQLRETGAVVYTPTLAGLGDRAHVGAQASVGLGTHVQDIVALLEFEDLHDVILVGHSYAGMVITGVAAAVPGRIKKLVYFDAAIPESGQSFFDAIAFPGPIPVGESTMASFPPEAFGLTDPAQIAFVGARLRPQPLASFLEPISFNWADLAKIPKAYIHCKGEWFAREPFLAFRAKALAWHWTYFELDTGHDAMFTAPRELYQILHRLRS